MLEVSLKERKSLIDSKQSDLTNKYKVIHKRYSNLQERLIANYHKMKILVKELNNSTTIRATSLFVNSNLSSY